MDDFDLVHSIMDEIWDLSAKFEMKSPLLGTIVLILGVSLLMAALSLL